MEKNIDNMINTGVYKFDIIYQSYLANLKVGEFILLDRTIHPRKCNASLTRTLQRDLRRTNKTSFFKVETVIYNNTTQKIVKVERIKNYE